MSVCHISAAPATHFKSILMLGGKFNICRLDHFTSETFNCEHSCSEVCTWWSEPHGCVYSSQLTLQTWSPIGNVYC